MSEKIQLKGHTKKLFRLPNLLLLYLIVVNACVYLVNGKAGAVLSAGLVLYLLIAVLASAKLRPHLVNELVSFAVDYSSIEKQFMDNLNFPYVLMDRKGRIVWGNRAFNALLGKEENYGKSIYDYFPEIRSAIPSGQEPKETYVNFEKKVYQVSVQLVVLEQLKDCSFFTIEEIETEGYPYGSLIALSFSDCSELKKCQQKLEEDKIVTALVYLDNYEEALEGLEEVRQSLLIALIDRKIGKYFAGYDGLVKKLEKDKYLILMKNVSLKKMKEKNFSILEDVKTIKVGNEMAVTLSMGIGVNAQNYVQGYEYARIAIEMALGRGGDQGVIKDKNTISYFGGKTQSAEKNTRVKARVKAQAMKEFMMTKERVVIMGHKITDMDALGAAMGIYRAAKTLGKPAHIVINDPSTSIRPLVTAIRNNAEYEQDLFVTSSEAMELVDQNTVMVVVDTNRPSYTECEKLLSLTKTIVVLDHHRRGKEIIENAVLSYVEPYASSSCEMVAEILQYFADGIRIRSLEADCMYAGIMIDTTNFTARAGVRTFEAAAFLRRNGADVNRVRKMLRESFDSYRARAEVVRSAEIYRKYYVIGVCPADGLESPTIVGAQAANELLNIENVKASFVLTEYQGAVYVSARSIDEVNVQVMMEALGGGGHMNLAGAQIQDSVERTRQLVKETIDQYAQRGEEKK